MTYPLSRLAHEWVTAFYFFLKESAFKTPLSVHAKRLKIIHKFACDANQNHLISAPVYVQSIASLLTWFCFMFLNSSIKQAIRARGKGTPITRVF